MKSIAFLKSDLSHLGGLEKYCIRLAIGFAQAGYKVYILTTDWKGNITPHRGVEVVNLGRRLPFSYMHLMWFDYRCKEWLRTHTVDCVFGLDRNMCLQHIYRAGNGVHAAYLARRAKKASWFKKISFSINPLHRLILKMEKNTFTSRELRYLITNSALVKQEVLQYYPEVDSDKVIVVHNGVEWEEMHQPFEDSFHKKTAFLESLGLETARYQFLFIGNEYERKGLPELLQALKKISHRRWNLLVVGKERHPKQFASLSESLGLQDNVFFFGRRKDVISFYQACDCLVVPSLYDPFANVTIEALAMGLYVISSDQNGGSEVLSNSSGLSFHDQRGLEEALVQAFDHPKTKSSAADIRAQFQKYDFSKQIGKIVSLVTH